MAATRAHVNQQLVCTDEDMLEHFKKMWVGNHGHLDDDGKEYPALSSLFDSKQKNRIGKAMQKAVSDPPVALL